MGTTASLLNGRSTVKKLQLIPNLYLMKSFEKMLNMLY